MTDKEPTQEQIKKFWEWCGWHEEYFEDEPKTVWAIFRPDGSMNTDGYPPIDLNNLFKYAVPKLDTAWALRITKLVDIKFYCVELTYCTLRYGGIEERSKDPALALFWAIWEVVKEEKVEPNAVM